MIPAQQVIDLVLATAARSRGAEETIVLVSDRAESSLRWAGNSMTTNGDSVSRFTTVISIVRKGDSAHVGSVESSDVDPDALQALVAASQRAAQSAPAARDNFTLLSGTSTPADWDQPPPGTGAPVFGEVAASLSRGFRGTDLLYGFAHHVVETIHLATSTGIRRRYTQPTGSVEINAKRGGASAWAGTSTPWFDAAGLVEAHRGTACRELRDHHAAVDGRRHDDLPGLDVGRPRRAGRPYRAVGPWRRYQGGGEAHRSGLDAVLGSRGAGAGMRAVRGGGQLVGDHVDLR
jgi:predicted Zn-dependent protease